MPLIISVRFIGDDGSAVLLEYPDTPARSWRLYALPTGKIADRIWDLMSPTVRNQYKLEDFDEYRDMLAAEYNILRTALPERRDSLRLHADFCRFLHPNLLEPKDSSELAPGDSLDFTWAGGIIGSARIYEGTIAAVTYMFGN